MCDFIGFVSIYILKISIFYNFYLSLIRHMIVQIFMLAKHAKKNRGSISEAFAFVLPKVARIR